MRQPSSHHDDMEVACCKSQNLVALGDSLQFLIVHTSCIHISLRHSLEYHRANIESEAHAHLVVFASCYIRLPWLIL